MAVMSEKNSSKSDALEWTSLRVPKQARKELEELLRELGRPGRAPLPAPFAELGEELRGELDADAPHLGYAAALAIRGALRLVQGAPAPKKGAR